jgi:hypothetical protein
MILKAVHYILSQDDAVVRLAGDRIYPYALPQKSDIPAIDMRTFGGSLDGQTLTESSNCFNNEVTLDCYGDDPGDADDLAMLALKSLPNFRGSAKGVEILEVLSDGSITQDSDGIVPGSDKRRFVSTVSFEITWSA